MPPRRINLIDNSTASLNRANENVITLMPDSDRKTQNFERIALAALDGAAEDQRELKTVVDLVGYLKVECLFTDEFIGELKYAQLLRLHERYLQKYEEVNDTPLGNDTVPPAPADASHDARAQSMDSGYVTMRADTAEKLLSEVLRVSRMY